MPSMKEKTSKFFDKRPEHYYEHHNWNFTPGFVSKSPEISDVRARALNIDIRSICGGIDESMPVEQYDGSLGVSRAFVKVHEPMVGQLQWRPSIEGIYEDPGDVAGLRWATGTLISRELFLTAGHVLDAFPNGWRIPRVDGTDRPIPPEEAAVNMQVNFGYQVDPLGRLRQEISYPVTELIEYRKGGLDYAILRLDGQPGLRFGFAQIGKQDSRDGDMLCIIQHPEGLPKRIEAGLQFHSYGHRIGYDSIDTLGGSSGSGILQAQTGLLVSVHTNGGCDHHAISHNHGLKMTAIARLSPTLQTLQPLSWRRREAGINAEAPEIKSDPALSASWDKLFVLYRSNNGNLEELSRDGEWAHRRVDLPGRKDRARGTPLSYQLDGDRRFITFRDGDNHLQQYFLDGDWRAVSPTLEAEAPPAGNDPAVAISPGGKGHRLYYISTEGAIILLWWDEQWRHANLSAATDAPLARDAVSVVGDESEEQEFVFFRTTEGEIAGLHRHGSSWSDIHLAERSNAPQSKSAPAAIWISGQPGPRLYYRARKNQLIELHWIGDWVYSNLTALAQGPEIAGAPSAYRLAAEQFPRILYKAKDKQIYLHYWDEQWRATNLSLAARAPKAKGNPVGREILPAGRQVAVYRGADNQLYELTDGP